MLDFVLGIFFLALLIRGWTRGFVKEAMDLLGVLLGAAIAFRLSGPAGAAIAATFGTAPVVSRLVAGVIIFVAVGLAAALGAHYLHKIAHLPGLALGNRLTGAGLALAWGVFLATLGLSLATLVSFPPALANQVEDSAVAQALTRPGGISQTVFSNVAGDRVVEVLVGLQDLAGAQRVVIDPSEVITFTAAPRQEVHRRPEAARTLATWVNEERAAAGVEPLEWSERLAAVAAAHARDMYTSGYFAHESPDGDDVADRVRAAGLVVLVAAENLALSADVADAHRGLVQSASHHANLVDPVHTHVGIGVMAGPLGLMVVQVFTG